MDAISSTYALLISQWFPCPHLRCCNRINLDKLLIHKVELSTHYTTDVLFVVYLGDESCMGEGGGGGSYNFRVCLGTSVCSLLFSGFGVCIYFDGVDHTREPQNWLMYFFRC